MLDYPEWELCVQLMPDGEHPELDFDPLDDTKRWPADQFPLRHAARSHSVLLGHTMLSRGAELFAASDQRAKGLNTHTNQRDGQMAYYIDGSGENKHVKYEPSSMGGLQEAAKPKHEYHQDVHGSLGRYPVSRTQDDYKQVGHRFRTFQDWERDDLVANIATDLKQCPKAIQLRMVWHFWHCDPEYGRRVAAGAGIDLEKAKALPPLPGKPAPGERPGGATRGHSAKPKAAE